jgi:hypothetical protein
MTNLLKIGLLVGALYLWARYTGSSPSPAASTPAASSTTLPHLSQAEPTLADPWSNPAGVLSNELSVSGSGQDMTQAGLLGLRLPDTLEIDYFGDQIAVAGAKQIIGPALGYGGPGAVLFSPAPPPKGIK